MFTQLSEGKLLSINGGKFISNENEKFEDVRKNNLYKYQEDISVSILKEEMEKIKKYGKSSEINSFDTPIKLILDDFSIELTLLPSTEDLTSPYELRYVIWRKKINSIKWDILEICSGNVNLDFEDNFIEEFMFDKLIDYINRNFSS